jgi:hypothetical protein
VSFTRVTCAVTVVFAIAFATWHHHRHRHHHAVNDLAFSWDDRRLLCSIGIDDVRAKEDWWTVLWQLYRARAWGRVALLHAHAPGRSVTIDTVDRVLGVADALGLQTVTYRDLVPADVRRPALALAFDDDDVAGWLALRPVLAAHHAHVTFFVCCSDRLSPADRAGLVELARDGHDIEPHGAHHEAARPYVQAHGLDGYVRDEVSPSLDALAAIGLPRATTFAFPGGIHDGAIDAAVLEHVAKVRVTRAECPW